MTDILDDYKEKFDSEKLKFMNLQIKVKQFTKERLDQIHQLAKL